MMASIKVKYKGSNPDFTYDGIYPVISVLGSGSPQFVIKSDLHDLFIMNAAGPDIDLFSIVLLDNVQIYP